jgi:hypothetical protein
VDLDRNHDLDRILIAIMHLSVVYDCDYEL